MKKTPIVFGCLLVFATAFAQNVPETNGKHYFPPQGWAKPGGGGGQNLVYHTGGTVIRNAKVVLIFWGSSFIGSDAGYASAIRGFRNQFGTTGEYNVITQYYGQDGSTYGNIAQSNLGAGTGDWFDPSTPPTNVTDADVQAEVLGYLSSHAFDGSTIYEVFIPSSSYSSDGSSTSCGGPNLAYCAYHGYFTNGNRTIKYSIEPWAGCSGCSSFNNTTLDQEHFVCHETREAVTDALLNAWYDRRGYEADDKCAWSPTPFIDPLTGFGYQYEWSNEARGCVKTR